MDTEQKWVVGVGGGIVLLLMLVLLALIGPKGCERRVASWKAEAYGSDWLVVQYAYDGSTIASWKLRDKSVGNEEGSDGIFFRTNKGHIIHLSGHYVYVQIQDGDWESAEVLLLKGQE